MSYESVGSQVFPDRPTALQAVPYGPFQGGQALPYAYFRAPQSSIIVPTVLSMVTAPRVVQTARDAVTRLKNEVQHELTVLALWLTGGMLVSVAMSSLTRVFNARLNAAQARLAAEARAQARLAAEARAPKGAGPRPAAPDVVP